MRIWEALFLGTLATPLMSLPFYAVAYTLLVKGYPETAGIVYDAGVYAMVVYLLGFYSYCGWRINKYRHLKEGDRNMIGSHFSRS